MLNHGSLLQVTHAMIHEEKQKQIQSTTCFAPVLLSQNDQKKNNHIIRRLVLPLIFVVGMVRGRVRG